MPSPSPSASPSLASDSGRVAGLEVGRHFTTLEIRPFDTVEWRTVDARIVGADGAAVFVQEAVEAPAGWSQLAVNVVASKYFRGQPGTPDRESSVRALIGRIVDTIVAWGTEDGLFGSPESAHAFADELTWLLLHQRASFNSPVWFNVGVEPRPQCSACFINSVDDTMESILELNRTEGMLFKHGSGSGVNLSSLRSSQEPLAGGGTASGPVSFMRGLDAFAGAIKSGGKTRRAAKMVILDVEHPDILEFVHSKEREELKAQALIAAGFDPSFDAPGGAYDSVAFQNANHSIRVPDRFLEQVLDDGPWTTRGVIDGRPSDPLRARELLSAAAQAAWSCGDPGIQFHSTINRWHTCPGDGEITGSNPCSEFMFLDDTACNLASLNLLAFWAPDTGFDTAGFIHAARILITAQEILVDRAGYPTPRIADRTRRFRPLGLGYSNLGGLLLAHALPYDSEPGRALAAAITAVLSGAAYLQSARLAAVLGPFAGFANNREAMLAVLEQHRERVCGIPVTSENLELLTTATPLWEEALERGARHGFRHAQATALAPTGTISFMMDCHTTGIEPEIALVKQKHLVGGGLITTVNQLVPRALERLGYDPGAVEAILGHLGETGTVEGAPGLVDEHLRVFDCALATAAGGRSISPEGHLEMLAAVQPFISGAISKTVNLPPTTTPEEIADLYLDAWRRGLKSISVYRDGCKGSQPLVTAATEVAAGTRPDGTARRRLPDERQAITHKFSIGEHEGYLTVGLYDSGEPGEIFLVMAKEGSTISGLMDAFATAISIALQYGVPLPALVEKFAHTRYEPSGFTRNRQVPYAKSVTDYIFRWLAARFLDPTAQEAAGVLAPGGSAATGGLASPSSPPAASSQQDAPPCRTCGSLMVRSGSCYGCANCGATSGCS